MKNLLTYISPSKSFNDCDVLARIQIDNSLSLGWKKEDIILTTNFPYEYNGIKATVVGDEHYCPPRPRSNKTTIIPYLIDSGVVGGINWVHDFDAYQVNLMTDDELGLDGFDVGLTDYGWRARWCLGSYFFKKESLDIFQYLREAIYKNVEDETAMIELTEADTPFVRGRIKRMDITYDLGMRHIYKNYKKAAKPIKVFHFHPVYKGVKLLDHFMYDTIGLGFPLMPERLIEIFKHHGIQ